MAMPELQVLNGSLQWKTIPLTGARFLIGRKDTCHLVLKDGWVSREHTLIMEPKPGEFRVQDLDSENGTFLNGDRIRDESMKHGDVLRVGRTEMRFMQHASGVLRPGTRVADVVAPESAGLAALTPADLPDDHVRTMRVDAMSKTATDEAVQRDGPRIDLRERLRRLEAQLLEGEQANAALAAENTVLKRSLARLGVLNRETGAIDASKIVARPSLPAPDAMLPYVTNPLARINFPGLDADAAAAFRQGPANPALVELGIVGLDAVGIRFAESLSRLGNRRAVAVTVERDAMRGGVIDPAWRIYLDRPGPVRRAPSTDGVFAPAMPRIEEAFGEAFAGCERVILCAEAGAPLAAEGIAHLTDVLRRMDLEAGVVLFLDPGQAQAASRARAESACAAARLLAESGRLAPLLVIDLSRTTSLRGAGADPQGAVLDSVAGTLDALLRLPLMPAFTPPLDRALLQTILFGKGWSTLGLAATADDGADADADAIESAFTRAVGAELLSNAMPPSRARAAFVCAIAGRHLADAESATEAARARVAKLLPQARRLDAVYRDAADSLRVLAFVGGLPYPETFFPEGSSQP